MSAFMSQSTLLIGECTLIWHNSTSLISSCSAKLETATTISTTANNINNKPTVFWKGNAHLTVAVADPRAEGGGAGNVLPVGRLEAHLLLPLPLLVPLLHLALAHPAWGQKDGVITAHYGRYIKEGGRRGERWKRKTQKEKVWHIGVFIEIREHPHTALLWSICKVQPSVS